MKSGFIKAHRYRFVEFPDLAENLIWELLGQPNPKRGVPISVDLKVAEQAMRDLIPRIQNEVAMMEKAKEELQNQTE